MGLTGIQYQHGGAVNIGRTRRRAFNLGLLMALAASVLAFPWGLGLWLLPLLIRSSAPRVLLIGPRYLICDKQIVYFATISRIELSQDSGVLALHCDERRALLIERNKFPTNARKPYKIAQNKAKKFDKLSDYIVETVGRLRPDAKIVRH